MTRTPWKPVGTGCGPTQRRPQAVQRGSPAGTAATICGPGSVRITPALVEVWYALAVLNTLTIWLKAHTLLYPFILFLLSALFSIYSKDIKQFLHSWPKTAQKARQFSQQAATTRLGLLKVLHNDSYQLLLYFGTQFVGLFFEWLFLVFIPFGVIGIVTKKPVELGTYIAMMGGVFMGVCQEVRGVLVQLRRYDQSVTKLQEEIERLKVLKPDK
jgi:hypothetical protein